MRLIDSVDQIKAAMRRCSFDHEVHDTLADRNSVDDLGQMKPGYDTGNAFRQRDLPSKRRAFHLHLVNLVKIRAADGSASGEDYRVWFGDEDVFEEYFLLRREVCVLTTGVVATLGCLVGWLEVKRDVLFDRVVRRTSGRHADRYGICAPVQLNRAGRLSGRSGDQSGGGPQGDAAGQGAADNAVKKRVSLGVLCEDSLVHRFAEAVVEVGALRHRHNGRAGPVRGLHENVRGLGPGIAERVGCGDLHVVVGVASFTVGHDRGDAQIIAIVGPTEELVDAGHIPGQRKAFRAPTGHDDIDAHAGHRG